MIRNRTISPPRVSAYIVSADSAHHIERIREIEEMGVTMVCLQKRSGGDHPLEALAVYGERGLPALRDHRPSAERAS